MAGEDGDARGQRCGGGGLQLCFAIEIRLLFSAAGSLEGWDFAKSRRVSEANSSKCNDSAGSDTPRCQSFSKKQPSNQGRENDARFPQCRDGAGRPQGESRHHDGIGYERDDSARQRLQCLRRSKVHDQFSPGQQAGYWQQGAIENEHPCGVGAGMACFANADCVNCCIAGNDRAGRERKQDR